METCYEEAEVGKGDKGAEKGAEEVIAVGEVVQLVEVYQGVEGLAEEEIVLIPKSLAVAGFKDKGIVEEEAGVPLAVAHPLGAGPVEVVEAGAGASEAEDRLNPMRL